MVVNAHAKRQRFYHGEYMHCGTIKQLTFILPKLRSALATDSGCDYFVPANMQKIEVASKLYP